MDLIPAPPQAPENHTLYKLEFDVPSSLQGLPLRDNWRPLKLDDSVYYLAITDLMANVQLKKELPETVIHNYSQIRSDEKRVILRNYPSRDLDHLFFQTGTYDVLHYH